MNKLLNGLLASFAFLCILTACDEDRNLSINLVGEWKGDFSSYYVKAPKDTCFASETLLSFVPYYPNDKEGSGVRRDYYNDAGKSTTVETKFRWEFVYEKLNIWYDENPDADVCITEYTLNDSAFFGFYGKYPNELPFNLRR